MRTRLSYFCYVIMLVSIIYCIANYKIHLKNKLNCPTLDVHPNSTSTCGKTRTSCTHFDASFNNGNVKTTETTPQMYILSQYYKTETYNMIYKP